MSKNVKSTFDLLEAFCKNNYPLGVTELSNILLEGKSSVYQKIKMLEELEYIEQEEYTKKYILTTKLLEMVNNSLRSYYERTNIHRYVKQVAEETGEFTYFGLRNTKNRIVYIDRYANENAFSVYTNVGDSPLPHCTAHGKALLSFLSVEQIEEVVKEGLPKFTEKTITTREALFEEIRKIRGNGYAVDDEERMLGVKCVAAPIFDSNKEVIGAIGISGMNQNMTDEKIKRHAAKIKAIAEKVNINIGNNLLF